jgi:hemoglobin-like flavoprotein
MAALAHMDMPSWCAQSPDLTEERIGLVTDSWKTMVEGKFPNWTNRVDDGNPEQTPIGMFCDKFYGKMFTDHPEVKEMFSRDVSAQGRLIVGMITGMIFLAEVRDLKRAEKRLKSLADAHIQRGVTDAQYGWLGEALLHGLSESLGSEIFNNECREAWIHLYSFFLKIIFDHVNAKASK